MKTVVKRAGIESIALVSEFSLHRLELNNFHDGVCDVRMTGAVGVKSSFRADVSELIEFFEAALKELGNES